MKQSGFSVTELLIVIVVIGALMTLGVVNLRGNQVDARDKEREMDTQAIAISLDRFYNNGSAVLPAGSYPATDEMGGTESAIRLVLRDIHVGSLRAPGAGEDEISLVTATNGSTDPLQIAPQPTGSTYVYQPLQQDGSLCETVDDTCRRFFLYYYSEVDELVKAVGSKNQ